MWVTSRQCRSLWTMAKNRLSYQSPQKMQILVPLPVISSAVCIQSLRNLERRKEELQNDGDKDFVITGVEQGFRISDIVTPSATKAVEWDNHLSAHNYSHLVEKELKDQLSFGYYVKSSCLHPVASPLGANKKDNCEEVRILHDGSRPLGDGMNEYCTLYLVKYQTLHEAYSLVRPGYYLAKVDLKSAYRSVSISPLDYCLTELK